MLLFSENKAKLRKFVVAYNSNNKHVICIIAIVSRVDLTSYEIDWSSDRFNIELSRLDFSSYEI